MNTQELAQDYRTIGQRLARAGYIGLAADYGYVSGLIQRSRNYARLVGELRRNLNRSDGYAESDKRNATLHIMAKTLERVVAN